LALYHDVLGRDPDASGEAAWLQALATGATRFGVAYGVATSVEHDSVVVGVDYQRYLGRSAGASEVAGWVNDLQHGMTNEQVVAAFVAYQVVFQRAPDTSGFNYWDGYLQDQLAGR
jgi:hypothetical protein